MMYGKEIVNILLGSVATMLAITLAVKGFVLLAVLIGVVMFCALSVESESS